jgi:integrase
MMVPLSQLVLDILEELPKCKDDEYLFTTTDGKKPISGFSKNKKRTDKASKVRNWRLHDLRRTGRTGLARLRVPEVVAERVLNHVERNSLKRIYDQYSYLEEKTEAMDKWAIELTTILKHNDENIVRLDEVNAG